jgi:hypothetical protein
LLHAAPTSEIVNSNANNLLGNDLRDEFCLMVFPS